MPYNDYIEANAEIYGYKSSNLMHLQRIINNILTTESGIKTEIPPFIAVSDEAIQAHLKEYAPKWQDIWNNFVKNRKAITESESKKSLSEQEKLQLVEIQELIIGCFTEHPISMEIFSGLTTNLRETDLVMVRSTGREDSTDLSNPGGNESKPSKIKDVPNVLGGIIASYFGEKSLTQRLNGGDDITRPPFMPVLVQKMIMETRDNAVISGVMYSDNSSTRIQAAPGYGELIVNSKGNFDSYYVTPEGMVYGEVRAKDKRLVTQWDGTSAELIFRDNSYTAKYDPALDEDTVLHLHTVASEIEKQYGRRMDIEFAYNPQSKTVFLLQARALTTKALTPSSIAPESIAAFNSKHRIGRGQVITPDVNRAVVIENPDQLIICQTISEALDRFVKGKTRAVIIEKEAPDTSHEAGEFNNHNIPVLQVQDIKSLHKLGEDTEKYPWLLDPQRKSLFVLPDSIKSETELYERGILKDGIFKSTLTAYSTPSSKPLGGAITEKGTISVPTEIQKNLGKLVQAAKNGDGKATSEIINFIYRMTENVYGNTDIISNLKQLESPAFNGDNTEQKQSLASTLRTVFKLHKNYPQISSDLSREIFLSGAELFVLLERMESGAYDTSKPLIYLNSLEKFTGLIKSLSRKDVLSQSVAASLLEGRHQKEISPYMEGKNLSDEQRQYFIEATKLAAFLINQEHTDKWYQFCLDTCQKSPKILGSLVSNVVKQNIHEHWINLSFLQSYEKGKPDSQDILRDLVETMPNMDKYGIVNHSLQQLESAIPLWAEQRKFPELFRNLETSLATINKELTYPESLSQLERVIVLKKAHHLVDIMDKTIKTVSKSKSYTDINQQCVNTKALIVTFFDMMKHWVTLADFNKVARDRVFDKMSDFIGKQIPSFTETSLSPSPNFAVNAAMIDKAAFEDAFSRAFDHKCQTLEDIFTLTHQNLIISIGTLSKKEGESLKTEYPPLLKAFVTELEKGCEANAESTTRTIKPEFLYSNLEDRVLTLHYNIPLRVHSAAIAIKYDRRQKDSNKAITVHYSSMGHNGAQRWAYAELYSHFSIGAASNIQFVQNPYFVEKKDIFSMEVALASQQQIAPLLTSIHALLEISFGEAGSIFGDLRKEKPIHQKFVHAYSSGNFNVNDFLIENPEIFTDSDFHCTRNLFLTHFKDKIDLNYVKDNKTFSILELHLLANPAMVLTHDFVGQDYSKHHSLLNIILDAAVSDRRSRRSTGDAKRYFEKALQIGGIKEVIYTTLFIKEGNSPKDVAEYVAFAKDLAVQHNIDITSASFIKEMLKIDSEKEDSRKIVGNIYQYLIVDNGKGSILNNISLQDKGDIFNYIDRNNNSALITAARKGDAELVTLLLENGADATKTGSDGLTALSIAVKSGRTNVIDAFMKQVQNNPGILAQNQDGSFANSEAQSLEVFKMLSEMLPPISQNKQRIYTDLLLSYHVDQKAQSFPIVEELLEGGADINARDTKDGNTALMRSKNAALSVLLLQRGADPSIHNNDGLTALSLAAKSKNTDVVEALLLHSQVDTRILTENTDRTSAYSHIGSNSPILPLFIRHKIKPTAADQKALHALLESSIRGDKSENIEFLVQHINKEDINKPFDEDNITHLQYAIWQGRAKSVSLLLQHGADDSLPITGFTPLSFIGRSLTNDMEDKLKIFLERAKSRPDILQPNKDGTTAFSHISFKQKGCWKLLKDSGIVPSDRDQEKFEIQLKEYITKGYEISELFESFKEIGISIDLNKKDINGDTYLIRAIKNGLPKTAQLLLEYGADPSVCGRDGLTPLSIAAESRTTRSNACFEVLLDCGNQKVFAPNSDGTTAFSHAADKNLLSVPDEYKELLNNRLIKAINDRDIDRVRNMLALGSDISSCDKEGKPALALALNSGDIGIINLLLEKGTGHPLQNKYRETATDLSHKEKETQQSIQAHTLDSAKFEKEQQPKECNIEQLKADYNHIAEALVQAAHKNIKNPSMNAQKKLKSLAELIGNSLMAAYDVNIEEMMKDFELKSREDLTKPNVLNTNKKINALGKQIIDILGGGEIRSKTRMFSISPVHTVDINDTNKANLDILFGQRKNITVSDLSGVVTH